jgi:hypothetical protein
VSHSASPTTKIFFKGIKQNTANNPKLLIIRKKSGKFSLKGTESK